MDRTQEEHVDPVDDVVVLFAERGGEFHGEVVDQRRHALQCASLARAAGAGDQLVAAALLHDVGHLVAPDQSDRPSEPALDDHHESLGARWVASRFGSGVARPVALHVMAKRYLCATDPGYLAGLSPASLSSQQAQGGLLDRTGVARFEAHPGSSDALALRQWDDEAKDPDRDTEGIDAFLAVLERLAVVNPPRR